ncbi:uncharacterized protein BXZ73DRAFT_101729 [Epithele typhae]|uniref:uncharacterized protein n=1 Tax=Epithele typhae TaxID=378194 RepID=UPI0020076A88|nr:uncharacterized protein BXZ73DRAFT_101729 [Epithele typhae]KAH9931146.1 hypothetical protein BXZ73DRAFT_101729 [Epithele typhae]
MVFGIWLSSASNSKEALVAKFSLTSAETKKEIPAAPQEVQAATDAKPKEVEALSIVEATHPASDAEAASPENSDAPAPKDREVPLDESNEAPAQPVPPVLTPSSTATSNSTSASVSEAPPKPNAQKRFSWRSLVQPKGVHDPKPSLPSHREEAAKEAIARQEYVEHKILLSRSDKRARESALVVRDLIVGPFAAPSLAPPKNTRVAVTGAAATNAQKVRKVKQQLLEPKSAQKVIEQLRQLPSSDVPVAKTVEGVQIAVLFQGPIHAVCLSCSDEEAHTKHFAKLDKVAASSERHEGHTRERTLAADIASVTITSLDKIRSVLGDLNIVSLIATPGLGFGDPVGSPGILAGAVPTAKAVLAGVQEFTPQLLALGYATGQSILPSHEGLYPPTDRMSVITYWWGLEIVIPEPSVKYLGNVPSIAHTAINFLTALSVANDGVREIMPFVRYISQYIDAEFNSIQQQDKGKGVVCAATGDARRARAPALGLPRRSAVSSQPVDPKQPATPLDPKQSGPGPILFDPPLPSPGLGLGPMGVASVEGQTNREPSDGVPGLTVTPPTPPVSQVLEQAGAAQAPAVAPQGKAEASATCAAPATSPTEKAGEVNVAAA